VATIDAVGVSKPLWRVPAPPRHMVGYGGDRQPEGFAAYVGEARTQPPQSSGGFQSGGSLSNRVWPMALTRIFDSSWLNRKKMTKW
jgi:hypothetical protein